MGSGWREVVLDESRPSLLLDVVPPAPAPARAVTRPLVPTGYTSTMMGISAENFAALVRPLTSTWRTRAGSKYAVPGM